MSRPLLAELDALKFALDLELGSRAVVQAFGQRGETPGSAAAVHEQTIALAIAAARALVAKADAP